MRRSSLLLTAGHWVLAVMVGCSQPTRDVEKTAKTADTLTSAEFSIACEAGTYPSVDVRSGVGLAAWIATDGTIHAARFDQGGNVLDPVPLALGLPSAPFETTPVAHGVLVIPTVAGFAVASELDSHLSMPPAFNYHRAQYRTVDLSGTISSPWTLVYEEGDSGSILASLSLLSGGFDGTHSYLAFNRMQAQGQAHPHWKHVYQLGGGSVLQVAPLNAPFGSPTWFDPNWGGFGCGAMGCLATWEAPQTNVPTAQVLGQSPVTGAAFVQGSVVATPSGFLQTGTQSLAFSPAGVVTAGPTNLGPFGAAAVYDGTATRAVWPIVNQGLYSATLADDTTITSGPTLEVSGPLNVSLASFGAGRSVVVYGSPTGVFGRFMGSLPASLPPEGCSGSGGAGGTGGSGATSTSSASSSSATTASSSSSAGGGATTTSSSTGGGTTTGTGSGGAASTSTSGGGGAGGATSASTGSTSGTGSSTTGSGGGPTGSSTGATTNAAQSSSSSGAGGAGETAGGGCVIAPGSSGSTFGWPLCFAAAWMFTSRRRTLSGR